MPPKLKKLNENNNLEEKIMYFVKTNFRQASRIARAYGLIADQTAHWHPR